LAYGIQSFLLPSKAPLKYQLKNLKTIMQKQIEKESDKND